jgi:hypothetical protein
MFAHNNLTRDVKLLQKYFYMKPLLNDPLYSNGHFYGVIISRKFYASKVSQLFVNNCLALLTERPSLDTVN